MAKAVSMDQNIPEGYQLAYSQEFTWESARQFLNDQCGTCTKSECKVEELILHGMGNNYPVWSKDNLLSISPDDIQSYLNDKVICKKYDEDADKMANYKPLPPMKTIYIYPEVKLPHMDENGQTIITSEKWD